MIPVLYSSDETTFSHNGRGVLTETITCFVSEERNGKFELEFTYPKDGRLFSYIETDCIVKAKTNDTSSLQLFRIYKYTKPINGIVTFFAEHISYELNRIPIEQVTIQNATAQSALNDILSAGIINHNFTALSDITTLKSTSFSFVSARATLGGVKGSILDTYGGEYEFDNFTVKLHRERGKNTGVKIAYGKNLTNIKQEKNISNVYTAVYPYAKYKQQAQNGSTTESTSEVTITLSEKIIYSPYAKNYPTTRIYLKDFSSDFNNEIPTEEALRNKAQLWVNTSGFDIPSVSITVAFKHIWKSPEYSEYAPLERVNLCDTVTVEYQRLGVSATAKIIKTKYNVLNEDYESLELGDAKSNFADTINNQTAAMATINEQVQNTPSAIEQAVNNATNLITGQNGGCWVLNPPTNPQEALILDTPNINTAMRVWRWNAGGLGYSDNGYNGPYKTAITMDGSIVADFITAGILNANIIKAGRITSQSNKKVYFDLDSGELSGSKIIDKTSDLFAEFSTRTVTTDNVTETQRGLLIYDKKSSASSIQLVGGISRAWYNTSTDIPALTFYGNDNVYFQSHGSSGRNNVLGMLKDNDKGLIYLNRAVSTNEELSEERETIFYCNDTYLSLKKMFNSNNSSYAELNFTRDKTILMHRFAPIITGGTSGSMSIERGVTSFSIGNDVIVEIKLDGLYVLGKRIN